MSVLEEARRTREMQLEDRARREEAAEGKLAEVEADGMIAILTTRERLSEAEGKLKELRERLQREIDWCRSCDRCGEPNFARVATKLEALAALLDQPPEEERCPFCKRTANEPQCSHVDTTLNGDGTMTCDLCGLTEPDPFSTTHNPEEGC